MINCLCEYYLNKKMIVQNVNHCTSPRVVKLASERECQRTSWACARITHVIFLSVIRIISMTCIWPEYPTALFMYKKAQSLGFETLFWNVSVSSQSPENLGRSRPRTQTWRSQSRLGHQHLVLHVHFQWQKFTELSTSKCRPLGLYNTACHSRSLCFHAIDSLSSCIIKHLYYLVGLLTYELDDITVHAITWIWQKVKRHIV